MDVEIISTTFQSIPLIIASIQSGTNNHMEGALLQQYYAPSPPLLEHQKTDFLVQMNVCSLEVQVVAVTPHSPHTHLFYQDQTFVKDICLHLRFIRSSIFISPLQKLKRCSIWNELWFHMAGSCLSAIPVFVQNKNLFGAAKMEGFAALKSS